jgi:hypothetical protein
MSKLTGIVVLIVLAGIVGYAATSERGHKTESALSVPGAERERADSLDSESPSTSPAAVTTAPADSPGSATRLVADPASGGTTAAMQRAAEEKKHLFVFVHEQDDEQTREGRKIFDAAVLKLSDAVQSTIVDRTASSEQGFVAKYGLKSAPMPVVLVFASNGVITGGFVGARLTEALLVEALASPAKQACLKGLQERKLVFLCVHSGVAKPDEAAMQGVNDFKADERFAEATEIVNISRSDTAEAKFLTQLEINPKVDQPTTVFLAPPGALIGKYTGATEKNKLVAALQAASSGGCSGQTGCCPPPK